jgi:hypothetical protein
MPALRPLAVSLVHSFDNSGESDSVNDFQTGCLKARAEFGRWLRKKPAAYCKQQA